MAFPGPLWSDLFRNKQDICVTGVLSAPKFSFETCDINTLTCQHRTINSGGTQASNTCDDQRVDLKKWESHCADQSNPCTDIPAGCKSTHKPSNARPCESGFTALFDEYEASATAVHTYKEYVPNPYGGGYVTYYHCTGTCELHRTCRGPVDLQNCMDLRTAMAWTLADRNPDEAKDLDLKTFPTSPATIFNASAKVSYNFDMSRAMQDDILVALGLWTQDLRTADNQTTNTVNGGPGTIDKAFPVLSQQIRDGNFVLAAAWYTYDNFFRSQYVGGTFYAVKNVLSSNVLLNYIHQVITKVMGNFNSQYVKDPDAPSALRNLLLSTLAPPRPAQLVDEAPVITLFVTYPQLLEILGDSQAPSRMISHFLRDEQSTVQRQGTATTKGTNPELEFTGFADVRAQMVVLDPNNYRLGDLINVTSTGELAPPSGYDITNMVAVHYRVVCRVKRWSIMLAAYFQEAAIAAPDFSVSTCNDMKSQIPIVARTCFESANPDTQAELLKSSCPTKYKAPTAISGQEYWLLYQDSKDPYSGGSLCSCFNANLGNPEDEDKPDAKATSRCFSTACTEDERQQLGLNDSVCSAPDKCALAELWVASKDPAEQGRDLDTFDWTRFALLCGKTIQPLAEVQYSWQMAVAVGAALVMLSSMAAVLLDVLPNPKLRKGEYWGVVVGLMALSILLGVGSGWAFAGEPTCNGKQSVCRSRLFKTPLLQASCPYVAQCECQFDHDCGGSCACTAGFCTSNTGARATKRVTQVKAKPELLVPLIALAVVVAVIAGVTSVAKLGKAGAAGLGLGLGLAFLGLALGLGIQRNSNVLVFDGAPKCDNNLPQTLTVLDVARQVSVTFPTRSLWTPSGFPSGGIGDVQQDPYLLPPEHASEPEQQVQKVYPEFKASDATRALMFLSNDNDDPSPRQYYIYEMPETQKGNVIAVARTQNIHNSAVDLWTVAWGKVSVHVSVVNALSPSVTVSTRYGRMYSDITLSGQPSQPMQTVGPQCLTQTDDAAFFDAAKQALGSQWDGESYETAIKTVQEDEAKPWFYYMQVNPSLAIACQYGTGFECSTGPPSQDLAQFPCRSP